MSDVFISYSRHDADFVRRLDDVLVKQGRDVWVDWEDIPVTSEWWSEIRTGIEAADSYVFVITQNAIQSPVCNLELAHAIANNKRILPIVRQQADEQAAFAAMAATSLNETIQGMFAGRNPLLVVRDNWQVLAGRNWLFFDKDEAFDASLAKLVEVLATDLERIRLHTRLLIRAREWDTRARDASFLLQGTELEEAEQFLAQSANKEPAPLPLQGEYILASQHAAADRIRRERVLNRRARSRLYLLIGVAVGVILAFNYGFFQLYNAALNTMVRVSTTTLTSALLATAGGLHGDDLRALAGVDAASLPNDPHYQQMIDWLTQTHNFFPDWSPSTLVLLDASRYEWIANPFPQGGANAQPGQIQASPEVFMVAGGFHQKFQTSITGEYRPPDQPDARGFISGYAPILDSSQQVVGLVRGVMPIPIETYNLFKTSQLAYLVALILDIVLITLMVALALTWFFVRILRFVRRQRQQV